MVLKGSTTIFTTSGEQLQEVSDSLDQQGFETVEIDIDADQISSGYVPNSEGTSILSREDINTLPDQNEAGDQLVDVRYSNAFDGGLWVGVYREDAIPTSTFVTDNYSDLVDTTKQQSGAGLGLIDLEYGDGTIVATYANTPSGRANGTFIASEDYDDFVAQVREYTVISPVRIVQPKLDLVDFEYIDGTYVGVLGDFRGGSNFAFNYTNYDEFQAEVQRQQSTGSELVDAEYIDGAWYGVFNENQDIKDITSTDFI